MIAQRLIDAVKPGPDDIDPTEDVHHLLFLLHTRMAKFQDESQRAAALGMRLSPPDVVSEIIMPNITRLLAGKEIDPVSTLLITSDAFATMACNTIIFAAQSLHVRDAAQANTAVALVNFANQITAQFRQMLQTVLISPQQSPKSLLVDANGQTIQ